MGGCRVAHFVVRRHAQHAGGGDAGDAVSSPDVGCGVLRDFLGVLKDLSEDFNQINLLCFINETVIT
jgi:hypothetical protein